jgi:hypothetical protein
MCPSFKDHFLSPPCQTSAIRNFCNAVSPTILVMPPMPAAMLECAKLGLSAPSAQCAAVAACHGHHS